LYYQAKIQSGYLTVHNGSCQASRVNRPQSDRVNPFRAKPSFCLGTRERTQNLFALPWSLRKYEVE
jgi:hypothetical protein